MRFVFSIRDSDYFWDGDFELNYWGDSVGGGGCWVGMLLGGCSCFKTGGLGVMVVLVGGRRV